MKNVCKVVKQPCPECGKKIKNQATHYSNVHGPAELKKFVCEVCEKRFLLKEKLVAHRLTHSENKPFGCKFNCGYFANNKGNADKHGSSKKKRKRYNSENDKKKVRAKGLSGDTEILKKFVCEVCEKRFDHKSTLLLHQLIHSEIRPFGCKFNCGYFAKNKTTAEMHARRKKACKKYKLKVYEKKLCDGPDVKKEDVDEMILLYRDTDMKKILREADIPLKTDICPFCFCPMRFELIEDHIVRTHMDINSTQNKHTCKSCNKSLTSNEALMVHLAQHQNKLEHRCQFSP